MNKYSDKLISDYILGNDIDNIDELENDSRFMLEAIKLSKDKNLYNLCSDEIKGNTNFVIELLNIFNENKDFCINIALNYLNYSFDKIGLIEVAVRINNINDKRLINYKFILNEFYSNVKDYYKYNLSDTVLNYVAKLKLKEIFNNQNNLEDMVHKSFKNKEDFMNVGIINYMISYINLFDGYISLYVFKNKELLNKYMYLFENILDNFDNYLNFREDSIINTIHNYVEYNNKTIYSELELMEYIGRELNMQFLLNEVNKERKDCEKEFNNDDNITYDDYYNQIFNNRYNNELSMLKKRVLKVSKKAM